MKKVAILQSNYVPWKGYFDLIAAVDEFILYDDVQFTKNDWRNRNCIKTPAGTQWLTIPVRHSISDRIRDVTVSQRNWNLKHWKTIQQNYGKARGFVETKDFLQDLYAAATAEHLSEINGAFILAIAAYLGLAAKITRSCDYSYAGDRSERLVALCKAAGAQAYLSGPAARGYLDVGLFAREGIAVEWADYGGYPEYPQLFPPFVHQVSVIDLIVNTGRDAAHYLKHARRSAA